MTRAVAQRFVALWVGLSATLAGPGSAFAHGFAHNESAEHSAHHVIASGTGEPTVSADEHHEEHGHSRLDPAVLTATAKGAVAMRSEAVTLASAAIVAVAEARVPSATESPPDAPGLPPPRSRAPPAL